MFITTSFSLLADKEQKTYEILFEELNKNIIKYSINNNYRPTIIHVDILKLDIGYGILKEI